MIPQTFRSFLVLFFLYGCFINKSNALDDSLTKTLSTNSPHKTETPFKVVSMIEPYSLIVKAIFEAIPPNSKPTYKVTALVTGYTSEHHFSLKPSHLLELKQADVVIVSQLKNEHAIKKQLKNQKQTIVIDVSQLTGIIAYPARTNHYQAKPTHSTPIRDTHYWLEPENARIIGQSIFALLENKFPEKKEIFLTAKIEFENKMTIKKTQWQQSLKPIQSKHFFVFHDAFQYLEKFGSLNIDGWLTESNQHMVSSKKWLVAKQAMQSATFDCTLVTPDTSEKIFNTLLLDYKKKPTPKAIKLDDIARDFIEVNRGNTNKITYFEWFDWVIEKLITC